MLGEFVDEMDLKNLNETLAEGRVTWCARNPGVCDRLYVGEWENA